MQSCNGPFNGFVLQFFARALEGLVRLTGVANGIALQYR